MKSTSRLERGLHSSMEETRTLEELVIMFYGGVFLFSVSMDL